MMVPSRCHRPCLIAAVMLLLPAWLPGQDDALLRQAREYWVRCGLPVNVGFSPTFDRITGRGTLTVFEQFVPASFLILWTDEAGYSCVTGYSARNLFYGGLSGIARQEEMLGALEAAALQKQGLFKGIRTVTEPLGPLISSQWGQGRHFNYYCPEDPRGPDGHVYAGCVAVAMGQIIRYYGPFNQAGGTHSYDCTFYGTLTSRLGNYNWKDMEDKPMTLDREASDLLADIGNLTHMNYGPSGSTTNSHRALEAFQEFGYAGATLLRKSGFNPDSWTEVFYQNLCEYKPVMVTGGGHAFVCDGYDTNGFFHFNLGWDGYGDGFYPLSGVMTMPVNEAFTELQPISWPKPAVSFRVDGTGSSASLSWSFGSTDKPRFTKVYCDGMPFADIQDTVFDCSLLPPGEHDLYISAGYLEGESRWIGPAKVFIQGAPVPVSDPVLAESIRKSLSQEGHQSAGPISEGDLARLRTLECSPGIRDPGVIGLCKNLRKLVFSGEAGTEIDCAAFAGLSELRILEWKNAGMLQPGTLGTLRELTELTINGVPDVSLAFLADNDHLVKLGLTGIPLTDPALIAGLPYVQDLILEDAGIVDASFLSEKKKLIRLDLSGNGLTNTWFLTRLPRLEWLDLSNNLIDTLLLTDNLKMLGWLDASDNRINNMLFASELNSLLTLDLSGNLLSSPGKLFQYSPVLREVDLSRNRIRDMGKVRSESLVRIDASQNRLMSAEWISLQPGLLWVNLARNYLSDLSGLISSDLYKQIGFLDLSGNPLSKQAFGEILPLLNKDIVKVVAPDNYQPLSPCYLNPSNGSRVSSREVGLQWYSDQSCGKCLFDVYLVNGDSLERVGENIENQEFTLSRTCSGEFSWMVAARTPDTVYYSGICRVTSNTPYTIPLSEGFDNYLPGGRLEEQSDLWAVSLPESPGGASATIDPSVSRSGGQSLLLSGGGSASLPSGHVKVPWINIKFSLMVPQGSRAIAGIENMNGTTIRIEWGDDLICRLFYNDKIHALGAYSADNWMDCEILAHARNNGLYVKVGTLIMLNEPWRVPEGYVRLESICFSSRYPGQHADGTYPAFYVDNVSVNAQSTLAETVGDPAGLSAVTAGPNPVSDRLEIRFNHPGSLLLRIIDQSGREVYREQVEAQSGTTRQISMAGFEPGVYLLVAGYAGEKPLRIVKSPPGY